jgi:hypothetical protein
MTNTVGTDITIDFPATTLPVGATPALVGTAWNEGPFFYGTAEGSHQIGPGESIALKFPDHTAGQLVELAVGTEGLTGRVSHVELMEGVVSDRDLAALSDLRVGRLVLGEGRRGKTFDDRRDLAIGDMTVVHSLLSLEASGRGLTDRHLASLGNPSALRILTLDSIPVEASTLTRFRFLSGLTVAGVEGFGDDLGFVRAMTSLRLLGIRFSDLTVDRLCALGVDSRLEMLDIAYNSHLGPDLSTLPCKDLTLLDISTTACDDTSLATLRASRLDELGAQCTGITDSGLSNLPPSLSKLNLAGTAISDEGLERIAARARRLTELDIRAAAGITRDGLRRWLPALEHLRVLGVSADLLDGDLAQELNATTGVEHLIIGRGSNDDGGWAEAVDIIGSARLAGVPV